MDISIYFKPSERFGGTRPEWPANSIGDSLVSHTKKGFPSREGSQIALFGVLDDPGHARPRACVHAPDAIRDEYRQIRAHLSTLLPTQIAKGDDPSVVADIVLRAVTARHPRARYTAGKSAAVLALLRRIAPAAMVDRGIRQSFKLDAVSI